MSSLSLSCKRVYVVAVTSKIASHEPFWFRSDQITTCRDLQRAPLALQHAGVCGKQCQHAASIAFVDLSPYCPRTSEKYTSCKQPTAGTTRGCSCGQRVASRLKLIYSSALQVKTVSVMPVGHEELQQQISHLLTLPGAAEVLAYHNKVTDWHHCCLCPNAQVKTAYLMRKLDLPCRSCSNISLG